MPKDASFPLDTIRALIAGRPDLVSRIGAPLWSRIGRPISLSELSWARPLLGDNGPAVLMQGLVGSGALDAHSAALNAAGLLRFLAALICETSTLGQPGQLPELVWTMPTSHEAYSVRGRSYLEACVRVINGVGTTETLALVAPFIDAHGIGALFCPLRDALMRRAEVRFFTHDALNIATPTSRALEELRREAERIRADLSLYSAEACVGRDRLTNPLFHAKLIASNHALLVSSGNFTGFGFSSNFEAGVLLGEAAAKEALFVLDGVLRARTVYLVFRTGKP